MTPFLEDISIGFEPQEAPAAEPSPVSGRRIDPPLVEAIG
jgi:hypothetical protein